jgi:prevent-host-death family protein
MVMERVRIAELKARLSHYLRLVRSGTRVVVLDRDRPVARLEPVEATGPLRTRGPAPGAPKPGAIAPAPPLGHDGDIVDLLLEERGER